VLFVGGGGGGGGSIVIGVVENREVLINLFWCYLLV